MNNRILIVDDEPGILLGIEYILGDEKYEIIKASNGSEAWKKIIEYKPDIILLDINMPPGGINEGIVLCKKIKSNPVVSEIPVIMLTVKSDKETGLKAGASDYITKPFNADELLQKIRNLL